jgi:hypothetical protein
LGKIHYPEVAQAGEIERMRRNSVIEGIIGSYEYRERMILLFGNPCSFDLAGAIGHCMVQHINSELGNSNSVGRRLADNIILASGAVFGGEAFKYRFVRGRTKAVAILADMNAYGRLGHSAISVRHVNGQWHKNVVAMARAVISDCDYRELFGIGPVPDGQTTESTSAQALGDAFGIGDSKMHDDLMKIHALTLRASRALASYAYIANGFRTYDTAQFLIRRPESVIQDTVAHKDPAEKIVKVLGRLGNARHDSFNDLNATVAALKLALRNTARP